MTAMRTYKFLANKVYIHTRFSRIAVMNQTLNKGAWKRAKTIKNSKTKTKGQSI